MIKPYIQPLEHDTIRNGHFRKVVFTGKHLQVVLMALKPGQDIGLETHEDTDQFFRIDQGSAIVVLGSATHYAMDGYGVVVPAGTPHNVINNSKTDELKLYTIYSQPEHEAGEIEHEKEGEQPDLKNISHSYFK